jgi:Cu+-exporting ATPase
MVLDELSLMRRLAAGAPAGRTLDWVSHRDPVCGMAIEASDETATLDGLTMRFCSAECRTKFAADPDGYLRAMGGAPGATLHVAPGAHP